MPTMKPAGTRKGKNPQSAIGAITTMKVPKPSYQLHAKVATRKVNGTCRGGAASGATCSGGAGSAAYVGR